MPLPPTPHEYIERSVAEGSSDFIVRYDTDYYRVDCTYFYKEVLTRASTLTVLIFSYEEA